MTLREVSASDLITAVLQDVSPAPPEAPGGAQPWGTGMGAGPGGVLGGRWGPCAPRGVPAPGQISDQVFTAVSSGGLSTWRRQRRGWGSLQLAQGRMGSGGSPGHTFRMGSASASPHLASSAACAPPGPGLPRRPCHGPASAACRNHHRFIAAGRGQRYGRVQQSLWLSPARGAVDPPPSPSRAPHFARGGTPFPQFLAGPPAQPSSWRGGTLREQVGAAVGAPGARGAAFPERQRGCSGRAGSSKPWRGAVSLGTAQRVSPSPAAEAMTLSIQSTYGAMRV